MNSNDILMLIVSGLQALKEATDLLVRAGSIFQNAQAEGRSLTTEEIEEIRVLRRKAVDALGE